MLGADATSGAIFSSCSESGAKASYEGEVVKAEKDAAIKKANAEQVAKAAKNLHIQETVDEMKAFEPCKLMAALASEAPKCYALVTTMHREATMVATYWENNVEATGGLLDLNNGVQKGKL